MLPIGELSIAAHSARLGIMRPPFHAHSPMIASAQRNTRVFQNDARRCFVLPWLIKASLYLPLVPLMIACFSDNILESLEKRRPDAS